MSIVYHNVESIKDPLLFLKPIQGHDIKNGSVVKISTENGVRTGIVLTVNTELVVVQVIEGAFGIVMGKTNITFLDQVFQIGVSREMMGRRFNGKGMPIDGGKAFLPEEMRDINGLPMNPIRRAYPKDVIQTGISSFDCLNTLVRGQKLPIFSGQGLPHNKLVAQIVNNAKVTTKDPFVTIFCGIGLLAEEALYFQQKFEERGATNVISFINLASDPTIERILIPRIALTTAEFLAYKHNMHVLVVMSDITNYAEALREISNVKGEIPARKGFPGYMYSDFASLYERAGRIRMNMGSITQIPVISMPNDDISHPIPDLTGYITEGQIVLSRDYHQKGIFPPIYPLASLSRLMKDSIGEGNTREDHADVSSQMYACYSKALEIRELESIIGTESLSDVDKLYLKFGSKFEKKFIHQGESERDFIKTLNLAWKLLSLMGKGELVRIKKEYLSKYFVYNAEEMDL
ncbi:V-type ATP synthase beta chain [Candidatus Lokiarchaeum ossiferum]|uniref:A-type ATP synthase subunit B n=1 Tax=Candidatus Lokiarchaeum ossiferum TaxID=2951803 RepID=A0ABY6HWW0_9ARCH|nr:V-type ATP synthase beta chain [Candidatus Lokiarchaeum sp. B-35]